MRLLQWCLQQRFPLQMLLARPDGVCRRTQAQAGQAVISDPSLRQLVRLGGPCLTLCRRTRRGTPANTGCRRAVTRSASDAQGGILRRRSMRPQPRQRGTLPSLIRAAACVSEPNAYSTHPCPSSSEARIPSPVEAQWPLHFANCLDSETEHIVGPGTCTLPSVAP